MLTRRLAAVVLAAGAGRRLGGPKALATWRGRTFLDHVLSTLGEAGEAGAVVVVLGAEAERVGAAIPAGLARVVNPRWDEGGMLSSILAGLDRAEAEGGLDGILVWPVDHPAVRAATVRALTTAASETGAPVVVPTHGGRRGHPVVFARAVFADLRAAPEGEGARAVVRAHGAHEVAVDDPGVLVDVDTPEVLARLRDRTP